MLARTPAMAVAAAAVGVAVGLLTVARRLRTPPPSAARPPPPQAATIADVFVYPVKGCAGVRVDERVLTAQGLAGDRAYMLAARTAPDAPWAFLTPRQLPAMVRIVPLLSPGACADELEGLELDDAVFRFPAPFPPPPSNPTLAVSLWDDELECVDCGDDVAEWLTALLNDLSVTVREVRLVHVGPRATPASRRLLPDDDGAWVRWPPGTRDAVDPAIEAGAFADGFPLLVVSSASLAHLNAALAARDRDPVSMARFRPNIVLDGLAPHGEDAVAVAAAPDGTRFFFVKPCARCSVPTVDPDTGLRSALAEPSATLRHYRSVDGDVWFGMNVVHSAPGAVVRVGDVLALTPGPPAIPLPN